MSSHKFSPTSLHIYKSSNNTSCTEGGDWTYARTYARSQGLLQGITGAVMPRISNFGSAKPDSVLPSACDCPSSSHFLPSLSLPVATCCSAGDRRMMRMRSAVDRFMILIRSSWLPLFFMMRIRSSWERKKEKRRRLRSGLTTATREQSILS